MYFTPEQVEFFEPFWDSGEPRAGEKDAQGWRAWMRRQERGGMVVISPGEARPALLQVSFCLRSSSPARTGCGALPQPVPSVRNAWRVEVSRSQYFSFFLFPFSFSRLLLKR